MSEVIALSYFTAKEKKYTCSFPFHQTVYRVCEIELINVSIRHMLGPHATSTHF